MTMSEKNDRGERAALSERIASAHAARALDAPSAEQIETARLASFDVNDAYREHAEELRAIVGHISDALPSWTTYMAQKDPMAASLPENRVIDAYASIENPACVFVWELKGHEDGKLASLPEDEYNEVLSATCWLKDLWEDEPVATEQELAKALIAQIVLLDDDLRKVVLERADIMARGMSATVAPYLSMAPRE